MVFVFLPINFVVSPRCELCCCKNDHPPYFCILALEGPPSCPPQSTVLTRSEKFLGFALVANAQYGKVLEEIVTTLLSSYVSTLVSAVGHCLDPGRVD